MSTTIHNKRINLGYSVKNVPLHNKKTFLKRLIPTVQSLIERMRWKVIFASKQDQEDINNDDYLQNRTNKYGFKTPHTPSQEDPELSRFESKLYDLINSIEFHEQPRKTTITRKLEEDISRLNKSKNVWVKADKTTNFYEVDPNTYKTLLEKSVTAQYRKCDPTEENKINFTASKIAKELKIDDRANQFSRQPAFITLKDHKGDFSTNPSTRLINPAKTDLGKVAKQMLDRIISDVKAAKASRGERLTQWRSTREVLDWFESAEKTGAVFLQFDIDSYYPSISEALLRKSLAWAKELTTISDMEESTILHAKKSLLFSGQAVWQKKDSLFDVTMGSWDGAENSDLVGLFLLNNLHSTGLRPNSYGLYRDDGLAIVENPNGPKTERIKKKIIKFFKDEGLKVTIGTPTLTVDFLDVTLDLADGSYKPFVKKDSPLLYVDAGSNHPAGIKNNIPKMIEKRICGISSDSSKFEESKGMYEEALKKSGHRCKMTFTEEPLRTRPPKKRQRRRNVIWFTPPFSNLVKTNLGRKFLQLLDTEFPPGHHLRKLFNRKTVKLSYSTLPNMEQIISSHNKKVLQNSQSQPGRQEKTCNCQKNRRASCPLNGMCLQSSVIYEAQITTSRQVYSYIGLTGGTFKERFNSHSSTFKRPAARKSTELSKMVWNLKDTNEPFQIDWKVIDRGRTSNGTSRSCDLCTTEKFHILENSKRADLVPLNKRSEIVSKCRHKRKFTLASFMKEHVEGLD